MFRKRSDLLAPLTAQAGNKKSINWTPECQQAFEKIKAVLAKDAFLKYPDHNQEFKIYADASDTQLGAAIFQSGQPVAYFSRKLSPSQKNYTVGEKELLSIVECMKEYRTMLFGAPAIHVYTDHKNNTFHKFNTQRVMRWRLFIEEFNPTFHYIAGSENQMADMLSRLEFSERQNPVTPDGPPGNSSVQTQQYDPFNVDSHAATLLDDNQLIDCFVHLPDQAGIPFVLDYETIATAQAGDAQLQQLAAQHPARYVQQMLAPNRPVYCYIKEINAPWKIYLPDELLEAAIRWYHLALGHVGSNRLHATMAAQFYHRNLRNRCEDVVQKCKTCQTEKQLGRGYGQMAPREAPLVPWREVAVDLIGPWKLEVQNHVLEFSALTIIDTVTNLIELVRVDNKTAAHIALHFENTWLSRYPIPSRVIHDQGGEFVGNQFQRTLARFGIHNASTSARNPQANSICERMHQVVGNTLRTLKTLHPPQGLADANQLVDTALANAMSAHRSTFSQAIGTTPGAMAFHQDMIMGLPVIADLHTIQQNRQALIDKRLIEANAKRFSHDYHVGDQVFKLKYHPTKMETRIESGPHRINTVHTNGTVTIQLDNYVQERISIRRIKPHRQ